MKAEVLTDSFVTPSDGPAVGVMLRDPQGGVVTYLPGYGDYNDLYASDDLSWLIDQGYSLMSEQVLMAAGLIDALFNSLT